MNKPLISFDYAIKYLLRHKGDFDIVEGFISALLRTQGYSPIKIISVLESESHKEDSKAKKSIADVVVEDEQKRKYIIEIERNEKYTFAHKACFNTSRLIVDHLSTQQDYSDIVKVFHISLLYFPIQEIMKNHLLKETLTKGAVYHGKTIFHEASQDQALHIHLKNPKTHTEYDTLNIFPEYFFISIPEFNDIIQSEMDEWLYVLKHDDIPKHFQSAYMEKVRERLQILKMTHTERQAYMGYMKQLCDDKEELKTAIIKGRLEGRREGLEEGKREIAKNLLSLGIPDEMILSSTGLTMDELEALKS